MYTDRDFEPIAIIEKVLESKKPPDVLYHYTGSAGLVGITESASLRLSHVSFLNDRSEMIYAKGVIADEFQRRMETETDSRVAEFLAQANEKVGGMFEGLDLYVACFCEDGDLLSQWRGYSKGAGMYSMGFSSTSLRKYGSTGSYGLWAVEYEPEEQRRIIAGVIKNGIRRHLLGIKGPKKEGGEELFDPLGLLMFSLSICLTFFKHASFAGEEEWRIVLVRAPGDDVPVSFREDPWYLTPFTKVHFEGGLPLQEIICGPAPEPPLATRSVHMLLKEHGYPNVRVRESEVPLRW